MNSENHVQRSVQTIYPKIILQIILRDFIRRSVHAQKTTLQEFYEEPIIDLIKV